MQLSTAAKTVNLNLKYFDVAGRAETIRIMLHVAASKKSDTPKIQWADTRVGFAEWAEEQKLAPLGVLPTMSVVRDGDNGLNEGIPPFCQTTALARFAAQEAGYYPLDRLDALIVDEAIETMNELTSKIPVEYRDEAEKKSKREVFQKKEMSQVASFLESRIQTFGGGKRFVSSGWSVADVTLWALVNDVSTGQWAYVDGKFFDEGTYPGIIETIKGIEAHVVNDYRDSVATSHVHKKQCVPEKAVDP